MESFQLNCKIEENTKVILRIVHLGHSLLKSTDKILFVHNKIKFFVEQALKSAITDFDIKEGSVWYKFIIPDDSELFFSLDQKALWDDLYIKTFNVTDIELINNNETR